MSLSRKKNQSHSNSAPANGLASQSQATLSQQSQFPAKSQLQSHSQSRQQTQVTQQSRLLSPWSAQTPPFGKWPSRFPRCFSALSTTATTAGELFLFGGITHDHICNDQYVISTRDFSSTLLHTSGDVPTPRYGHCAVLTSTILLTWGGISRFADNIVSKMRLLMIHYIFSTSALSREWTRIVINGPGPGGRLHHTMTLVGSKLFVFGGVTNERHLNDIWALDLDFLRSNPFWESYDPAPGNKKPLPRSGHVSVTTGDHIIIFGGGGDPHHLNDTWSFNISARKWTELQCTGSIPSPRTKNAAVLVDGVMYVFGGRAPDGAKLGDLTAFSLSTQRWIAFQDIAPSPTGRYGHAMAYDGTRVFVLGGHLSPDTHADETELIHVLDIKRLVYPEPDLNAVSPNEKTTEPVRKSSPSPRTREQPHQPSSSSPDTHAAHGASPFQNATPEELSETLVSKTERDQRIGQLIDELALKSALLELAEAYATGEKKRARRELRRLQAKLDESLLSYEQAKANAAEEKKRVGLELRKLRAKLDESLLSYEQAKANAAEEKRRAELGLRKLQAKLDESLLSHKQVKATAAEEKRRAELGLSKLQAKLDESLLSHKQAEANAAEEKERAGLELRDLQARLDESLQSRDHALEQVQSALQKASCAAEANEQSQRELTEMRVELEASKSKSAAFRLQFADTENGDAENEAEADTYRTQTATGLVNTNEDQVVHRLMERMQAMEAEIATLRRNEKSFQMMECRNEG